MFVNSVSKFAKLIGSRSYARLKFSYKSRYMSEINGLRPNSISPETSSSAKMNSKLQPIILSDRCIQRMKSILGKDEYLRVTVDGGGCSGFLYNFQIDNNIGPDDNIVEEKDVKVVVDSVSLDYLRGSTIDYHEELIRSSFRVLNNPKAEHGCSCGASFSIKL